MQSKQKENIFFIVLTAVCFILYLKSLHGPFILDDNHMIVENSLIKNHAFFPMFFKGLVTSFPIAKGMCRPLLMLTFAFNYLTCGLNPIGYRIINILFHILNVTLLYAILKSFKKDSPQGLLFLISALFAVHPINSEAIIYISSRSDLMVTFFILAGFILHAKGKTVYCLLLYAGALLTKETGLCFGLLIFAYDFINKRFSKERLPFYTGLILVTFSYFLYKMAFFASPGSAPLRSYLSNSVIQSVVTSLYLKLFLLPNPLNLTHPVSLSIPSVAWAIFVMIGLITLLFASKKKYPLAAFAIAWLLIGLLPKFYARLDAVSMEHHFYMSSIGLYILLLVVLGAVYSNYKKYTLYVGYAIALCFSILIIFRNFEYSDPLLFWKLSAKRNQQSGTINNNLGLEYLKRNFNKKAKESFEKAILTSTHKRTTVHAMINLSNIYRMEKNYPKALSLLKETLKLTTFAANGVYQGIGIIYMNMGKEKEAIAAWNEELKNYPGSSETFLNLGIFYLRKNNTDQAKEAFKRAVFTNSSHYAGYYGLAQTYEKENQLAQAISMYEKAAALQPNDAATHYFLGAAYAKMGDSRAINELKKAIYFNPRFHKAHNDLAIAYASLVNPKWKLAKKHAKIAKELGYKVKREFLELLNKN
ncbi:MAG: tetratricopeptide repeat protein [Candidatus Omnitrophica bacterium]|nr:tetratricopeptide repeat protein [Candidatus Omnitrophota bacterium]